MLATRFRREMKTSQTSLRSLLNLRSIGRSNVAFLALVLFASVSGSRTTEAAPNVANLSLRGLRIGGSTTLVIDGSELAPNPTLLLPWSDATYTVQPSSTPAKLVVDVTLPTTVTPGIYSIRCASASGVSSPIAIGVDKIEQKPWATELASLPVALHGALAGDMRLRTSFTGRKGQPIAIDVECQRLGSAPRPVVRLIDARGVQLAWSPPHAELGGDARIDATLPNDGVYTVEVHDLLYRAAAPGAVRVKIGEFSWANLVFPTGVKRGAASVVEWRASRLSPAGGSSLNIQDPLVTDVAVPPPSDRLFTGHLPRVAVTDGVEFAETSAAASPGPIGRAPLAISGRLGAKGEEDRFTVEVAPNSKLQFDVYARRIGSPLDGVLTLLGAQGNGLASADDRPGTPDPMIEYTVPGNVDKVIVSLRDLNGRGGDEFVYRIVVRDVSRPDASVVLPVDRLNVPAGGTVLVPLQVTRQNYGGPLQVEFNGTIPAGVTLHGTTIAPGASQGLVSVTVPAGTAPAAVVGRLTIKGGEGTDVFVRAAQQADSATYRVRPWARTELALAATLPGSFTIAWAADGADETLPLGWKLNRKVVVQRGMGGAGAVRLRLMSTQPTPKKTVKQNNMDVQVDDVDRTLRLDGAPTIAADQNEIAVALLAPADLGAGPWSLALVAELLGADNKTVVATASTPVKTLGTRSQLALQVTSPGDLEGKAGMGETGKVTGKITRTAGWDVPVTVSLAGLPEGVKSPEVVVAAGQTDFVLPLNFAAGTKVGELKGLRVVATAPFDPQQPAGVVRSTESPLNVKIVPGS